MDSLRMVAEKSVSLTVPCCRCGANRGHWDRIAAKAYCPQCEEAIILGEGEPLIERRQKNLCTVCHQPGTLCYLTFPLQSTKPVEMDLCGQHLRDLLSRRLPPYAFHQLQRQLHEHGFETCDIFLLHEAFYDPTGRALHPIREMV